MGEAPAGYRHQRYAASLAAFGKPLALRASGGWVLRRPVADTGWHDAMGVYPLCVLQDWTKLAADLTEPDSDCVSLTMVTDPFGDYDPALLHRCFPDVMIPFKNHYVVDLQRAPRTFISAHHRRNARKALATLTVDVSTAPLQHLDDWVALYGVLTVRHAIQGIQAFSPAAFAEQLQVPGIVVVRALAGSDVVGMHLWYRDNGIGYYHLGACTEAGYRLGAAFALFSTAIDHFADTLRWLSLGAGAGLSADQEDGLSRFKGGWATGTRTAYFGGRILDKGRYAS
ncbi:MAG: GNAT family N-acetyltransferase, partial [Candidatus Sericytochromatia bacterium]|nr:GNAT family N-acetyltransferase [Candidatus Sericytochromatia bacterium]